MRPYLVIPKLVEQPTWGGAYIAKTKGWHDRPELAERKIGQSYELFSGSNLSLCVSSDDPNFVGELADRDTAQVRSRVPHSVPLSELIEASPGGVLGADIAKQRGADINVLIKFTQALGNSFQVHPVDGQNDIYWKPKSESWYYFEPGLLTLGVKHTASWQDYQAAVLAIDTGMREISSQIKSSQLTYEAAKPKIQALISQYDPWQFVNQVAVNAGDLVDLSAGGIHHSWEEDTEHLPLGNVLYEVQTEAMDDVSTLRSFDRGKISADGAIRAVHIDDYFRLIDRSPEANNPQTHMRQPITLTSQDTCTLVRLLDTKYYRLDRLTMTGKGAEYAEELTQFSHLFVRSGQVTISAGTGEIVMSAGHSCFVPADAKTCTVRCESTDAEVLISR